MAHPGLSCSGLVLGFWTQTCSTFHMFLSGHDHNYHHLAHHLNLASYYIVPCRCLMHAKTEPQLLGFGYLAPY